MAMENLEERAIKVQISVTEDAIKDHTSKLQALREQLVNTRKRHFLTKWKRDANEVLRAYAALVDSCCYQGGEGYKLWLNTGSYACHWVVHSDKFADCQPTQMDHEAHYAIHGHNMVLPTTTHYEHWGN